MMLHFHELKLDLKNENRWKIQLILSAFCNLPQTLHLFAIPSWFETNLRHFSLDMLNDICHESATMDQNWIVSRAALEMSVGSMRPLHFQRHLPSMRASYRLVNNSMVRFLHPNCVTTSTGTFFPILLIWKMNCNNDGFTLIPRSDIDMQLVSLRIQAKLSCAAKQ